ncbi:MAG: hypothetical protein CL609_08820 [Anaerolineaceae bacterium]|nr:hypothetical protein [Anaerolineaceae bacterium]
MILSIFTGCTITQAPQMIQTPQLATVEPSQPKPSRTITVVKSLPSVESYIQPSVVSITPTPTSESAQFHVKNHCPSVGWGLDEIDELPGTLVFGADNKLDFDRILSPIADYDPKLTFWMPQTKQTYFYTLIGDDLYYYFAESPDKEKLAFMQGKQTPMPLDLMVVNQTGEEITKIIVPDDWTFFNWLNDEQLLLRQYVMLLDVTRGEYDLVAVNFLSQEQEILPSDLPDIYLSEQWAHWGSATLFNPDADLVLYPIWLSDQTMMGSVLWNVDENKEVTRIFGSGPARWSLDGRYLLLTVSAGKDYFDNRDEIFLIQPDGELTRITFLSDYYGPDDEYSFTLPAWSPDNSKIAFWIITQFPIKTAQLAVLDLETSTVHLFCNEINPYPRRFGYDMLSSLGDYVRLQVNSAIPIWSPDSRYLLIEDDDDTLLFDTQIFTISKIAENARPVGWLK